MSVEPSMKQEIEHMTRDADGRLFTVQVHIKEETEHTEAMCVKQEPPWEADVSEAAPLAGLYTGHEAWGPLVLVPEVVQQQSIAVKAVSELNLDRWVTLKYLSKTTPSPCAGKKTPAQDYTLQPTTDINTYMCDTCGNTFRVKRCLIHHMKLHMRTNTRKYPKNSCIKISEHMKKQKQADSVKSHFCETCGEYCTHSATLNNHKCIHKGDRPYSCEICKKKLINLKKHKRVHAVEKPFSCDICKKVFPRSDQLNMHKRRHTGFKPYGCEICSKQFGDLRTLKNHTRIHTGYKPYCCEICGREFGQIGNMKRHELIHTGKTPFCCDVCSKQFIALSDLKRHKRTHTNERPYSCEICKKKFRVSSQLSRHKRIHTREKSLTCDVCNERFSWRYELVAHQRTQC